LSGKYLLIVIVIVIHSDDGLQEEDYD
jgi:hypothetical protein